MPALEKKQRAFIRQLESSLLVFPDDVPRSSIISASVRSADATEHTVFKQLFRKYIGNAAEWRVAISAECLNENVELYRRFQSACVLSSDLTRNTLYAHTASPTPSATPIPMVRRRSTSESATPPLSQQSSVNENDADLRSSVEALDNALQDVIKVLDQTVLQYKTTPVE